MQALSAGPAAIQAASAAGAGGAAAGGGNGGDSTELSGGGTSGDLTAPFESTEVSGDDDSKKATI